jgi:multidrug efflux pump subunit AcrA (membrane-fusion protein)
VVAGCGRRRDRPGRRGRVRLRPAREARGLAFSVAGTVIELNIKPGDQVTAGQVLARIDSTDAKTAVDTATTSVNNAQDALTKAQQTPSPSPSATACAKAVAAPAALVAPAAMPAVPAALSAITRDDPSTSTSGSASASASASATPTATPTATATSTPTPTPTPRGGGPGAGGGATPGGGATTGGARSACGGGTTGGGPTAGGLPGGGPTGGRGGSTSDSLMQAQQQLTNAQLTLKQAQDKLAGTTITAPVAGRVLSVTGAVGAQESPGGTGFIVLGGLNDSAVRAQFSEADVARLAIGQPAMITLPTRNGEQVKGKLSQIDPAATTSGRLVRYGVSVVFDTVPENLLLGQSANVGVITDSATDVLYALSTAVRDVNNGAGTVTVRTAGHDIRRTVQVGLRGDQYTVITSGVAEGDQLVISGSA